MAKNYIQDGETVDMAAPYAVASGAGALVGSLFGVSLTTLANGAIGSFRTCGVFDLAKVSAQAWAVGDKIYWDNTAKLATTVLTSNTLIGVAVKAAANPTSTGNVRLNGTVS